VLFVETHLQSIHSVAKLALRHLPGARIVISSSNEGKCEKAVEEIKNEAPQDSTIQYVVGDVGRFDSQHEDVEAVLKAATEKFGSAIDHIVWTAGSPPSSLQTDQKGNQDILAMATSRIYGPLALTTLAKKYMNDSRHSSITITSGVLIYRPVPGRARAIGAGGAMYVDECCLVQR
jgi:NAD(P)-dependent dehydrogenase (short-subunit alcohol dehydrogenase family)